MLLLMLLLMMMVPRAGRLVDRSRMSTRWRWRWSRRRRRRRHHTERCEADGNKEMRTCGCTYIFRRISWKKDNLELELEANTTTHRRLELKLKEEASIYKRGMHVVPACVYVCVCLTFDLFYEVFFLSEVLSLLVHGKQPLWVRCGTSSSLGPHEIVYGTTRINDRVLCTCIEGEKNAVR